MDFDRFLVSRACLLTNHAFLRACEACSIPAVPIDAFDGVFSDPQAQFRDMLNWPDGISSILLPVLVFVLNPGLTQASSGLGERNGELLGRRHVI